jgi:hypothetical protein
LAPPLYDGIKVTHDQLAGLGLGEPIFRTFIRDEALARMITTIGFACGCVADDVAGPENWTRRTVSCRDPRHRANAPRPARTSLETREIQLGIWAALRTNPAAFRLYRESLEAVADGEDERADRLLEVALSLIGMPRPE